MAHKALAPNLARFHAVKNRIADVYQHQGDAVRAKATLMTTSKIFEEMKFLVSEVKRLGGTKVIENPERFAKIAKFVDRIMVEQEKVIAHGEFIKINADIFGAYRFLVNCLQSVITPLLEDDVAASINRELLPDDRHGRITLDLEDGLTDETDLEGLGSGIDTSDLTAPPKPGHSAAAILAGDGKDDDLPGSAERAMFDAKGNLKAAPVG